MTTRQLSRLFHEAAGALRQSESEAFDAENQRLSRAGIEGAGDGVAAKGLTVGRGAGAAPVVVGELEEGGALAVVEIGLV